MTNFLSRSYKCDRETAIMIAAAVTVGSFLVVTVVLDLMSKNVFGLTEDDMQIKILSQQIAKLSIQLERLSVQLDKLLNDFLLGISIVHASTSSITVTNPSGLLEDETLWNGTIFIKYWNGSTAKIEGPVKIHAEETDQILKLITQDLAGNSDTEDEEERQTSDSSDTGSSGGGGNNDDNDDGNDNGGGSGDPGEELPITNDPTLGIPFEPSEPTEPTEPTEPNSTIYHCEAIGPFCPSQNTT